MSVVQDNSNGHGDHKEGTENGYQGGIAAQRTLTPGGHFFDDNLLIAGSSHRKIANPVPTAAFGFATTTLILSLFNCGVQGITVPNAVVSFALFHGGFVQYLGGLWEFASGNTYGATLFCTYGLFWWGLAMLFIPWFNELGSYDGVNPGVFMAGGLGEADALNSIGLFLFVWLGITICLTFPTFKASIALVTLLNLLNITFILLGAFYYTGNPKLQLAGGIFGCILAFNAYYVGLASLFTKNTSFFALPTGPLGEPH